MGCQQNNPKTLKNDSESDLLIYSQKIIKCDSIPFILKKMNLSTPGLGQFVNPITNETLLVNILNREKGFKSFIIALAGDTLAHLDYFIENEKLFLSDTQRERRRLYFDNSMSNRGLVEGGFQADDVFFGPINKPSFAGLYYCDWVGIIRRYDLQPAIYDSPTLGPNICGYLITQKFELVGVMIADGEMFRGSYLCDFSVQQN
ncbi:MAG: hypothetical protein ACKVQC_05530 [Elusimicrobiota bacterium]